MINKFCIGILLVISYLLSSAVFEWYKYEFDESINPYLSFLIKILLWVPGLNLIALFVFNIIINEEDNF